MEHIQHIFDQQRTAAKTHLTATERRAMLDALWQSVLNHEAEGGLFDFVSRIELSEIVKSTMKFLFVLWIAICNLLEPWMGKSICCTISLGWILLQQIFDQIFCFNRNLIPCFTTE